MTPATVRPTRSPWLLCRRRRPGAPLRLYCFPHSGGSAGEYLRWSDGLDEVELWGIQPPGRGSRLDDPPLTSMTELVHAVVEEIDVTGPFAFVGHSLGALVAYETALALRRRGLPGPVALIPSAYAAPHLHRPGRPEHHLDGSALLDAIEREYGLLPPELHEDPELSELVLAGLRADLTVVAGYRAAPADPLTCPIIAIGGLDDQETSPGIAAWADYTTDRFDLRMYPGGHFYFREQLDDVLDFLAGRLAELADRPVPRAGALGPANPVP